MMTELQSDLSNDACYVKTIIGNSSTYTFNWTVENFSQFLLGTEILSPTFQPRPNANFVASLVIKEDWIAYFKFRHYTNTRIRVKHISSIENKEGTVVLEQDKWVTYGKTTWDVVLDFPFRDNTIIEKAREENVLIFKCVMTIYEEDQTDIYYRKTLPKPVALLDGLSALSNELKVMHDKNSYTDVNLKVSDSIVPVHKLILCTRSSVFARMFETPMDEREENAINITDLDPSVLKDLVSYLYTGVLAKDDFESVYALYYAADKYDVSSLRKMCSGVLLSKLDVENACSVLALADRHADNQLKGSVVQFIKFFFERIHDTEAWDELDKNASHLTNEIISVCGKNRKVNTESS